MRTTSSRDNWERLVAAVIKRDQIWQLCHQDSITTVYSDFSQRDLSVRSRSSTPSQLPLTKDSAIEDIEIRKNGSGTITQKLFSALLWRKKHKDYDLGKGLVGIPEDHFGLESFSLRELQVATDHFTNKNFLGLGGFGIVYKGRLADGSLVAVKRYREEARVKIEEELEIMRVVKHRNVIGPRGFCISEKERLIVYPYMANGSVASCLRERHKSQPPLEWETRLRIALGVARGLDYLHHGCIRGIIHRDVKAENILLDEDFDAVVSDFSLAIFMDSNDDDAVKGTVGHIAPEYQSTGKCSLKTDVFGYGIFLLELVTGQRAFNLARLANDDGVMLLDWVWKLFKEKKINTIVDLDLEDNFVEEEVQKLLQIALISTQTNPRRRPTMSEIMRMIGHGDGLDIEIRKNGSGTITQKLFSALLWRKKHKDYDLGKGLDGIPEDHFGLESFSLRELQVATNHFTNKNILGFGNVYKGRLADGSIVAVKRYREEAQVKNEEVLEIMSIVKHRNIIGPRGLCISEKERLIVCPYMANGSVASWLRERHESQPPLEWKTRLRIALGVARGLDYLHHGCIRGIIHRDVKAANILLDEDFDAIVSDFSLAIFMDSNDDDVVRGTYSHIAPEYLSTGKCSLETDVFGYGIFLLELVTGRQAFYLAGLANDDGEMFLDKVKSLLRERGFEAMVDRDLKGTFVQEEVEMLFRIALISTQTDPQGRPTMSEIMRMLEYGDGLGEAWEEFSHNVYQDENYSWKLHPSAEWIIDDSCFTVDAEELSGPR